MQCAVHVLLKCVCAQHTIITFFTSSTVYVSVPNDTEVSARAGQHVHVYTCIHLRVLVCTNHVHALGVLCCSALFVCLTLLASFFLPSHLSFKNMYMYMYMYIICTCY